MLKVDNLRKRYDRGNVQAFAVQQVSFAVQPGEFFTLLGPSGCGKTTTLRSIAGLETPDEGEILIADQPVFSSSRGLVMPVNERDIAMVFQSYAIWPHMTVGQNVAFPLEALGVRGEESRRRVERALEMVGLASYRDRPAPMLSGGQQQRVALARAIVKEARVLLLDEPLSNLDAKLREQMRVELSDLQRRIGTTAIYVTHDQDEAMSLSDRVAVMNEGRVVELAPPRTLYLRPQTAFTARFVGQADLIDCTLLGREGSAAVVDCALGRVRVEGLPADLEGALSLLIRPEHIDIDRPSGERVVNQIDGTIERLIFSGRIIEYFVKVGDQTIRVQGTSREIWEAGATVRLLLPAEHCVVVRRNL